MSTSIPPITPVLTEQSDLMTNYLASSAVSAKKPVATILDNNGNPVIFSVGTDSELWVAFRSAGAPTTGDVDAGTVPSKTGWVQYDLTSGIKDEIEVLAFDTTQSSTGDFAISIAVAATGSETSSPVYVTGWISNTMANTDWAGFASTANWTERQAEVLLDVSDPSQGSEAVSNATATRVLCGDGGEGSPLVIVVVSEVDSETHYFVNGDPGSSDWSWAVYPMSENADEIHDIAFGYLSAGTGVYGTYVLYSIDSKTSLQFVGNVAPVGTDLLPYTHPLTPPDGANCLAAIPDPKAPHYSNLYVGGEGVSFYSHTTQVLGAKLGGGVGVEIIPATTLSNLQQMILAQDSENVSLWVLDHSTQELLYTFGPQDSNAADQWASPVILQKHCAHIAAARNPQYQSNQIVTALSDNSLALQWQDPATTTWCSQNVPLEDTGQAQGYTSYTSTLHFADEKQNALVAAAVTLTSPQWAYVTINGYAHEIGPETPATVQADANGNITIIKFGAPIQTDEDGTISIVDQSANFSISTPIYQAELAELGGNNLGVNPAANAISRMADVKTGDDLQTLFPEKNFDSATANFGALSLQNLTAAIAALPQDGTQSTSSNSGIPDQSWGGSLATGSFVPMSDGFSFVDAVEAVAGDIIRMLESAVEDIGQFVFNAVEGAIHFVVEVGEKVFSFVISAIGQALDLLNWIIYELLGIDIEQILKWLGFLFEWGDIVTTHKVFTNVAQQTMHMLENELGTIEDKVNNALTSLLEWVDGIGDNPIAATSGPVATTSVSSIAQGVQPQSASGQDGLNAALYGSGGNFAYYQTLHGGVMSGPVDDFGTGGTELQDFVNTLVTLVEDVSTEIRNAVTTMVTDYQAGTLTIEEVIGLLTKTLLESLINLLQALVEALFEIAELLLQSMDTILFGGIEIPFLTALYKLIAGGDEMSLVDGMSLLAAIPTTIFYKAVSGKAPFEEGTGGLETATSMKEILEILGGDAKTQSFKSKSLAVDAKSVASELAVVYSQIGGGLSVLTGFVNSFVNMAQALSEGELKFASKVSAATTFLNLAGSIPLESDLAEEGFDVAVYLGDVGDVLIDGCMFLSPPEGEFAEEELKGLYGVVLSLWDLVMNSIKFGYVIAEDEPEGDELGWEIEAFIEDILDSVSTFSSGVSDIAGDENPEVELPAMAIAGGVQFLSAVLGLTRAVHTIEQDIVFHK